MQPLSSWSMSLSRPSSSSCFRLLPFTFSASRSSSAVMVPGRGGRGRKGRWWVVGGYATVGDYSTVPQEAGTRAPSPYTMRCLAAALGPHLCQPPSPLTAAVCVNVFEDLSQPRNLVGGHARRNDLHRLALQLVVVGEVAAGGRPGCRGGAVDVWCTEQQGYAAALRKAAIRSA